ncbi:fluconazole resistance protein [Phyllosticta citricarpa]
MISFVTFLAPLASSMFAPGVPDVMKEYGTTSNTMATFVVSVFVRGFASGALVVGPLGEMYGHSPVYHATNIGFTVFNILCARADNVGALVAYRFWTGVIGVGSVTNGDGSISDMMPPGRRGTAMAFWAMGPLMGPTSGFATFAACSVLRETYPSLLLERRAARLRKTTSDPRYRSALATGQTNKQLWRSTVIRPTRMAIFSPVLVFICVYTALAYGILYILFTTYTFVFEDQYRFSTSSAGLSYLGSGLGSLIGLAAVGKVSDGILRRKMAAGIAIRPDDRLDLRIMVPTCLLLPAGVFLYGWSAGQKVHLIVPMIDTAVASMGMIVVFICIQTYLVDAFGRALALVPVFWWFYGWGERVRTDKRFQREW